MAGAAAEKADGGRHLQGPGPHSLSGGGLTDDPSARGGGRCGERFEVDEKRYCVTKRLGKGAYGTVCAAVDHRQKGAEVAIKKVERKKKERKKKEKE